VSSDPNPRVWRNTALSSGCKGTSNEARLRSPSLSRRCSFVPTWTTKIPVFAGILEPSDGLDRPLLTMEVRSWYWRTRPTTRGHVFPANHHFESCRPCTRVLARARSDVPVSYPRLVVCVEHTPKREARRLRPAPALFFMTFHRRDRPRESTRATPCSTLDELVAAPDAAVRAEELELEPHAFHCARSLWRPARRDLAYL
jgi:hypothetical protein